MYDINRILEEIDLNDIIKIVKHLGGEHRTIGKNEHFNAICHEKHTDKYNLVYYEDIRRFKCYSGCSDCFDIFELIKRNRLLYGITLGFKEIIETVINITGKCYTKTKEDTTYLIDDWDFIDNYTKMKSNQKILEIIDNSIFSLFTKEYNKGWLNEGITIKTMEIFNIQYYKKQNRIIIPHFDINGNLVGIRTRALNKKDIENYGKYMPLYTFINGESVGFAHSLSLNLYGLYQNLQWILKYKKIRLYEGEKSILIENSYFEEPFCVASCGSSISNFQLEMILNLDIEVFELAYDKDFDNEKEMIEYFLKLIKKIKKFTPYIQTFILFDTKNLLGYQDSPCDKGKETLEKLEKTKIEITTDDIYELELLDNEGKYNYVKNLLNKE